MLSEGLGMETGALTARYCREVVMHGNRRVALKEKPNLDCIFWGEGICGAYVFRPLQCRSYPFWHSHLASRSNWETLESSCPGIGKGRLHTREEIEGWLRKTVEEHLINRSFA